MEQDLSIRQCIEGLSIVDVDVWGGGTVHESATPTSTINKKSLDETLYDDIIIFLTFPDYRQNYLGSPTSPLAAVG